MIRRVAGLGLAAILAAAALYLSAYWTFRLWPRQTPPLGLDWLRPGGNLVAEWLRGTPLAVYDTLVWGVGVILALSLVQWIWSRLAGS